MSDPLERLRAIIEPWPETREKLSHGAPTWWGGRKTFATFADNHHGDGWSPPSARSRGSTPDKRSGPGRELV